MSNGAKFDNPSKREKKLRQGWPDEMQTDWEDGITYQSGQTPRAIPSPKDLPENAQIVSRLNLLLQKISQLENRVARLEGQLRKRKGK